MTTVSAGQTYMFSGTLAAGATLTGDAGDAGNLKGAVIGVTTAATNDGTINLLAGSPYYSHVYGVSSATLDITGVLTNTGPINLAGGQYAENYYFGSFPGAQLVDSGTLNNSGTITVGSAKMTSGYGNGNTSATLTDSGVLTNTGFISLQGGGFNSYFDNIPAAALVVSGLLTDAGTIAVGAGRPYMGGDGFYGLGATLSVDARGTLVVSGVLANGGTVTLVGGADGDGYGNVGATVTVTDTGALNNTGVLTVGGGVYPGFPDYYGPTTGATLTNDGIITNSGSILIEADFSAGGIIAIATAGVLIDSGTLTNTGSITVQGSYGCSSLVGYPGTVQAATLAVGGVLTNRGMISLDGGHYAGGDFYLYSGFGADLSVQGRLANSGGIVAGGGQSAQYGFFGATDATIDVSGTLTNSGEIVLLASTPWYSGATAGNAGPGAQLIDQGLVVNAGGAISLEGGAAPLTEGATATVVGGAILLNKGVVRIGGGSHGGTAAMLTVDSGGRLIDEGTISGAGVLVNDGTLISGGNDVTTGAISATSFVNNGTVELASFGALFVGSAVTASAGDRGIFDLSARADLTLDAAVARSQTINVSGDNALLGLGDAQGFAGLLANLQASDTIDFLKLDVTSASASGTTLAIVTTTEGTLDLRLAMPLSSDTTLSLGSDGSGGTDLIFGQGG